MEENTTEPKKMQVSAALRLLTGIVDSMEAAGIDIINATASSEPSILLARANDALRQWAAENELDIIVEEHEATTVFELCWYLHTEISGVEIRTYISDEEKEAWENEAV